MITEAEQRLAMELAHDPDPGVEDWQESLVFVWYDDVNGIGGMHRVGHTPNRGTSNVWCGIWTADGAWYRRDDHDLPLHDEDREPPIFRAGAQTFRFDERMHVDVVDDDVEIALVFDDFISPDNVWLHTDRTSIEAQTVPNHLEASGRVSGRVRIGGKEWTVDALAQRDHSWGSRDWNQVGAHRWVVGTCGPGLCYSLILMVGRDGRKMTAATVTTDGLVRRSKDVEIVTLLDFDGLDGRGGWAIVRFDDGSELRLDCEAVGGWTFTMDDYTETDLLCRVTASTGHVGFCDFEYSNRREVTDVANDTPLLVHNGVGK